MLLASASRSICAALSVVADRATAIRMGCLRLLPETEIGVGYPLPDPDGLVALQGEGGEPLEDDGRVGDNGREQGVLVTEEVPDQGRVDPGHSRDGADRGAVVAALASPSGSVGFATTTRYSTTGLRRPRKSLQLGGCCDHRENPGNAHCDKTQGTLTATRRRGR